MKLTIDILFKILGGRDKTKALLGVSDWSIYKYRKSGIPAKHLKTIAEATGLTMEQVSQIETET